jgi:predicted hydrocarbon binding protein
MTNSPSIALSMNPDFIISASLLEIIGRTGITAVLNFVRMTQVVFSDEQIKAENGSGFRPMEAALESIYGNQVSAGIAFRAGRVSFKYFLSMFGEKLGFSDIKFRLLPMNQRKLVGLSRISKEMYSSHGLRSVVRDQKNVFLVEIENCVKCNGEKLSQPTCHFIAGFLQEYLAWIGGGRFFSVKESSCLASGGACCTFELSKQPID